MATELLPGAGCAHAHARLDASGALNVGAAPQAPLQQQREKEQQQQAVDMQRFRLRAASVAFRDQQRPSDLGASNAADTKGGPSSDNASSAARVGGSMLSFLGRNLPSLGWPPVATAVAAGAARRRSTLQLDASPFRNGKKPRTNAAAAGGPTWASAVRAAGAGPVSQAPVLSTPAVAPGAAGSGEALTHALANQLLRQIDVAMATGYPGEEGDEEDIAALQGSLHAVLPSLLAAGEEGREHLGLLLSPVARRMQPPPLVKTGRPPRHLSNSNSTYGPPPGRGKKKQQSPATATAAEGKRGRGRPPASSAPGQAAGDRQQQQHEHVLAATAAALHGTIGGRKRRSPEAAEEEEGARVGGVAGTLLAAAAAAWDQEQLARAPTGGATAGELLGLPVGACPGPFTTTFLTEAEPQDSALLSPSPPEHPVDQDTAPAAAAAAAPHGGSGDDALVAFACVPQPPAAAPAAASPGLLSPFATDAHATPSGGSPRTSDRAAHAPDAQQLGERAPPQALPSEQASQAGPSRALRSVDVPPPSQRDAAAPAPSGGSLGAMQQQQQLSGADKAAPQPVRRVPPPWGGAPPIILNGKQRPTGATSSTTTTNGSGGGARQPSIAAAAHSQQAGTFAAALSRGAEQPGQPGQQQQQQQQLVPPQPVVTRAAPRLSDGTSCGEQNSNGGGGTPGSASRAAALSYPQQQQQQGSSATYSPSRAEHHALLAPRSSFKQHAGAAGPGERGTVTMRIVGMQPLSGSASASQEQQQQQQQRCFSLGGSGLLRREETGRMACDDEEWQLLHEGGAPRAAAAAPVCVVDVQPLGSCSTAATGGMYHGQQLSDGSAMTAHGQQQHHHGEVGAAQQSVVLSDGTVALLPPGLRLVQEAPLVGGFEFGAAAPQQQQHFVQLPADGAFGPAPPQQLMYRIVHIPAV